jgi:Tol biopolymer transport system component
MVVVASLLACGLAFACGIDAVGTARVSIAPEDAAPEVSLPEAAPFVPRDAADDGDAAVTIDAGGRCNPNAPFGAPSLVPGINTANKDEANAWLTPNELTLYLVVGDIGNGDSREIYTLTRTSTSAPFTGMTALGTVNSTVTEDNATATADGLSLFFGSNRAGGADIFVATRPTTAAPFGNVAGVANVNLGAADNNPFIVPNGLALYFDSDRDIGNEIYVARRSTPNGGFNMPVLVAGVNEIAARDVQPILTPDELTIVFGSNRGGNPSTDDLYIAKRTAVAMPFATPIPIAAANTNATEIPTWISADGCVLWFTSDRIDGVGGRDIWETKRP